MVNLGRIRGAIIVCASAGVETRQESKCELDTSERHKVWILCDKCKQPPDILGRLFALDVVKPIGEYRLSCVATYCIHKQYNGSVTINTVPENASSVITRTVPLCAATADNIKLKPLGALISASAASV